MSNNRQHLSALHLLAIAVFATIAIASSFYYGITTGNDFHQHFQFASSVYNSVASGEIYPSFVATPNHGLGDIALRFYPPLAYYVLSMAFFVCGSWYLAALFTFWLIFLIGGVGVYLLAREESPSNYALLASAIYILTPFHLNEIYNNFLLAEFAATAILPFCLLFIARICRTGGIAAIAGLSASYALLILCHLPLTVIGSIGFVIYAVFLLRKETAVQSLARLVAGAASGLVLSSFYWIRMVREMGWVKHSSAAYFADTFSFDRNFLFKPSNWTDIQNDVLSLWFADLMLAASILIVIPALMVMIKDRRTITPGIKAASVLFIFSVFMATPLSSFIWKGLPFLQKVQFPWRWMAMISLTGAIVATPGIMRAADVMKRSRNPLVPVALGVALVGFVFMAAFVVKQAVYISRADFNKQIATIAGDSSYEGWWPTWANEQARAQGENVSVTNRSVDTTLWQSTERCFTVSAGDESEASVKTFYYPHWKASVNGAPVEVAPTPDGLISFMVPAERSEVRLVFQEPGLNRFAFYISAAGWIIILIGLIAFEFTSYKRKV